MSGKRAAALAWAARGLRVFPLQADSKLPLELCWTISATTDPETIHAWWTDPVLHVERDYNVGFLTSHHVVLDVDTKRGKPGLATMRSLTIEFDTLATRTPTGGFHLVYQGRADLVGQSPLGPGIDVRSFNGYVVAPGSTIDGVPYVVECELPVAPFPEHLKHLLRAPRARRDASGMSIELDQPEATELAAHWLRREASIAVQGENGDDVTYRTACRVRDFGVSETTALDLMLDCWNERCEPPWSPDELQRKVENAYRYAKSEAGSASPQTMFGHVANVASLPKTSSEHRNNGGPLLLLHEDAAAQRFASLYGGRLRYDHDAGRWFEWVGTHWRSNGTGLAFHLARELARELARDEEDRVQVNVGRATFASGVERYARSDPVFAVEASAWDRDPFLLGTPGGTFDLRSGSVRAPQPDDGITKITEVTPAKQADCPIWLRFLNEATGGDASMVRFLQRWCGYSLTGDVREQALVFVYGDGGTGKGVFSRTIASIMGDYAVACSMDALTASHGDRHPAELAMLRGARLVTASETEEGRFWAESRLKQMTGGDPITARFMRKDFFTFDPSFKLLLAGNHPPGLRNVDHAVRRRFNIVPFDQTPETPDLKLETKLGAELPAIMRWMLDGCNDWQRDGLGRSERVSAANDDYFTDQDGIGAWLEENCVVDPGNREMQALAASLFASWSTYCLRGNEQPGTRPRFAAQMKRRGFTPYKGAKGVRLYRGIALRIV